MYIVYKIIFEKFWRNLAILQGYSNLKQQFYCQICFESVSIGGFGNTKIGFKCYFNYFGACTYLCLPNKPQPLIMYLKRFSSTF